MISISERPYGVARKTPGWLACAVLAQLALAWFPASSVQAQEAGASPAIDLSLEELLKADVQTASRKSQRLQDVAAAAFVITREDIERSGATSIPEALRMAPGVQVARLSNNRWAVSARGFNGRITNKLLVLLDGRSIYSPLFSGVLWEAEDTLMEDIDRIEVIRGPGAALWGANAVNGVINIITRKARDTRGTLAVVGTGTEERAFVGLRHGVALESGDLRFWAKAFNRDTSVDPAGNPGNDYWRSARVGFRGDWSLDGGRRLTVSGAAGRGDTGDRWNVPSLLAATGSVPTLMSQSENSANLLARHEWRLDGGAEASLQGYVSHSSLTIPGQFSEQRNTIDLDFQHRLQLGEVHDVIWGAGYRQSSDAIASSGMFSFLPLRQTQRLASVFVQDDISLKPDTLRLVLGGRLEHNTYTGLEFQPNARMVWTPAPRLTFWGAASRAVRTPARAEQDAEVDLRVIPANPPSPAVLVRNFAPAANSLQAEVVKALELGYRQQFDDKLSLDVAMFSNRYTRLRGGSSLAPFFDFSPVPHVVQPFVTRNTVRARTHGVELALDWRVSPTWRIQPAYAFMRVRASANGADPAENASAAAYEASAPRQQLSVRSSWTLRDRSQIDVWLRHVGSLPSADPASQAIPAYTTLDLRYAWRPNPGFELSIVGQNLLQRTHAEFFPDQVPSQLLEVQRGVYVKAKWQF